MPAPIIPAPRTPTLRAVYGGTAAGRSDPELIAWRSKKNAWIMSWVRPVISSAR